jgi:hypothetical protein
VTGRSEAEAEQAARELRDKTEDRQRRIHGRFKSPRPAITLGEKPEYLMQAIPGTKDQYRLKRRTHLQRADTVPNGRAWRADVLPGAARR